MPKYMWFASSIFKYSSMDSLLVVWIRGEYLRGKIQWMNSMNEFSPLTFPHNSVCEQATPLNKKAKAETCMPQLSFKTNDQLVDSMKCKMRWKYLIGNNLYTTYLVLEGNLVATSRCYHVACYLQVIRSSYISYPSINTQCRDLIVHSHHTIKLHKLPHL